MPVEMINLQLTSVIVYSLWNTFFSFTCYSFYYIIHWEDSTEHVSYAQFQVVFFLFLA